MASGYHVVHFHEDVFMVRLGAECREVEIDCPVSVRVDPIHFPGVEKAVAIGIGVPGIYWCVVSNDLDGDVLKAVIDGQ
jgi:hypothetical protein